jgi:hypothetical protein
VGIPASPVRPALDNKKLWIFLFRYSSFLMRASEIFKSKSTVFNDLTFTGGLMHPRAVLRTLFFVSVACIVCLVIAGCGKQQKQAPSVKMPQVGKEATSGADTADIFKEFYSEDSAKSKAGAKSKKSAKQETFSPSSSAYQPEFSAHGRYTVQITCVRSQSFADQMTRKMKDKGYPAYVAQVDNPTPNLSGTYYRVRIGGFDGLSAAKSFGQSILTPSGYDFWVDKKSNDNVGMEGYGLGSGSAGSNAARSYDNTPAAGSSSSYQSTPPPAETPSSSTYISPSSSSSSSSGAASSPYQQSPSTPSQASPSAAPAATSTQPSSPAASASQASQPAGNSSGTTGSSAKPASSSESGWGSDSASKSGW